MTCISANIVGVFFIGLLIFDMSTNSWNNLPFHAVVGIVVTVLYTGVCFLLGDAITSAVLFVPGIFLFAFLLASWLLRKNLLDQKCCVTCAGYSPPSCTPTSAPIKIVPVPVTPVPKCKPTV